MDFLGAVVAPRNTKPAVFSHSSTGVVDVRFFQNANSSNGTGTGAPAISGRYPLETNSDFALTALVDVEPS